MTIRAAVMTAPGAPIEVRDLPDPDLLPGSVLLETIASEVCGTDVHLWHGRLAGVPYPIVPGHVSVGRVAELRGVDADALGEPLAVGDPVTFYDVHEACWAEAIHLLPGVRILPLPPGLEPDDVIGGGCGLFTGFAAVERADIALGDTVLVQGSGPVGLAAAAFAALRGAAAVLVIGAPRARLDLALRLGADDAIDVGATSAYERAAWIAERTGGRGADVAIEATGSPAAVPEGLRLVRDGGTYVVAGHYTDAGEVALNPHTAMNRKHVDLRGQWGTDFRHVARALALLGKHRDRLAFREAIGRRYGLDGAQEALEDVAALRVTKAVIAP